MADNSLVHLRQSLQRFLDAGFTVGAHHAFYGQGLFHSGLLLLIRCSCIFLRCGLHKGSGQGRDVFGRVVMLCAVQVKQVQPQSVAHHAEAGKAHGSCAEHGIQRQPQGNEHTGCQRDADDVVDKCPEKVLLDISERCTAESYCRRNVRKPALHQHHISRIYGNVSACTDSDSHICTGKGGSVVDSVADHDNLSVLLKV